MIIAMRHEMHGIHIAYSDAEAKLAADNGWVADRELSKELAGQTPVDKSLADRYFEKFGKKPHHLAKAESIEKALRE